MNSIERVEAVLDFRPVDYPAMFDQYWGGFVNAWRAQHWLPLRRDIPLDDIVYDDRELQNWFGVDLYKIVPDESAWPSQREQLGKTDDYLFERDGWGRTIKRHRTSPYGETIEAAIKQVSDLESLVFEDARSDARYTEPLACLADAQQRPHQPYVFIKIGGPFLRASFLRGEFPWYIDLAGDQEFAKALIERVTDHLIAVGVEMFRRSGLAETMIWIFDDLASNHGPLISPACYEKLFLPALRRMVRAFSSEGIPRIGYHSDGDIRPLLDMLVDAGITILNPIEPRANMDVVSLREQYGKQLSYVGGLCNSLVLPRGSDDALREHVRHVMSLAAEGGLIVGSHSICNDVSQERYHLLMQLLHEYGRPLPGTMSM